MRASKKRISEPIAEQIADIPGGGLQDFRPGHSSSSSLHVPPRVHEALDEPGEGFFRTFPQNKKSAKLGPHLGSELLPESSPSTRRAHAVPMVPEVEEPVLAESEEEDPDRWKDEFARTRTRSELFPTRWYLHSTGLDVDLIWERQGVRLLLLVLRDGCVAGKCVFLEFTEAFGRISCPCCARAFCKWKFGALFLYDFVSSSLFLGIWVLHVGTEHWILREMTLSGEVHAWFDSGYGVCVSTWLLDEFHTISTFMRTRILKYFSLFSRRMENCAQPMLQLAVPWCAARTWNSGTSSHGILVADMCDSE